MNTDTPLPAAPARPRYRWLKRLGWAFVWLITLLALGAAVENFLGARAWRAAREKTRAAGEPLETAQVIPPPAADAENFAAIPLFNVLFNDEIKPGPVDIFTPRESRDPAAKKRVEELRLPPAKGPGNWRKGQFVDLAAWQRELKVDDQVGTPGAAVLGALRKYDPDLDALREAAKRPRSRFPIRYQDHVAAAIPHVTVLMNLTRIVALRSVAELAEGKTDAAHADLLLGFALAEAPREDPLLISQLVRIACLDIILQPLWEGLARRQWSDAQLAAVDEVLQRPDFLSSFQLAMRGERLIFCTQTLDSLKGNPALLPTLSLTLPDGRRPDSWGAKAFGVLFPVGWIDFNKAALSEVYAGLVRATDVRAHQIYPQQLDGIEHELKRGKGAHHFNPRRFLAFLVVPAVMPAGMRCASAQSSVDLARVAIGLERHRLAHGAWPESLATLPGVRTDVIGGAPLHYRIDPEGGFTLYSIGWNQRDDGGVAAWKGTESKGVDWQNEDWVWPAYPRAEAAK